VTRVRALAALAAAGCASHATRAAGTVPQQIVVMMTGGQPAGAGVSSELGLVDLDGSDLEQLTHDGTFKFLPHFSPDGTKLAYTKFAVGGYGSPDAQADVAVLDLVTGVETMVTTGGANVQGTWSPDGKRLAYLHGDKLATGVGAMWIVDVDGSNAKQIAAAAGTVDDLANGWGDIAWSPAGDWILFTVQQNVAGCFKVRTDKLLSDGSARTQVSDGGANCTPMGAEQSGDADPGWSHDGTTIYSSRGFPYAPAGASAGTERKLFALSSDAWLAGKPETDLSLASEPDCIEGVPKGSPDGTRILVFRACFDAGGATTMTGGGLYVTDTAGSYRTFVTAGFGGDWNPVAP